MRALLILLVLLFAVPARAAGPVFGERFETNGDGFACETVDALKEVEFADKANESAWVNAIPECIFLRAGTPAYVLETKGPHILIRLVFPRGGSRLWVHPRSLRPAAALDRGQGEAPARR